MGKAAKIEQFFQNPGPYRELVQLLRATVLSTSKALEETCKWGGPVYTYDGKNIVGIVAFKQHAALWFFQGALLSDPAKVLVNAQQGKTRAMMQWRFQTIKDVKKQLVKQYVAEAIKNQLQGLEIKPDRGKKPVEIPELLGRAIIQDKNLRQQFFELSKAKQKEYCDHIASAKQAETKQRRLEKIKPMIKRGVGLNDKYRLSY